MNDDEQHLRLLSIFHYIVGGLTALLACLPVFHFVFGIVLLAAPQTLDGPHPEQQMPPMMATFMGVMLIIIPVLIILMGWTYALCVILAGKFLAEHRHYMYCLVMAGLQCIFPSLGTVLGVFTIIVLVRPSVKQLFGVDGGGGNPFK